MKFYIYLITNLINNKKYIGKSNNPKSRWGDHKKIGVGGKEKYPTEFFAIHAALNKYGIDNFKFETIEEFDIEDIAYFAETKWINYFGSNKKDRGYNCNSGGRGGIAPTEETRQKMIAAQNTPEKLKIVSDNMKSRHKNNPGFSGRINLGNQYTKGRILLQEEKDHLSEMLTGRVFSEETKRKMSEVQSGEKHPMAKLTEKDVIKIRDEFSKLTKDKKKFCKTVGLKYNVSYKTIENIVYRLSWKHI